MNFTKVVVQACCRRTNTIFKLDRPISQELIASLVSKGFTEAPQFTKAGILYVDNLDFILTGPLGSDRLQVRCKEQECTQKLNELEGLFLQLE